MIETKTLRYTHAHRVRTADAARWLSRRRYSVDVRPVICVARARKLERVEGGVLLISLDRLVPALHRAATNAEHQIAGQRTGALRLIAALRPPPRSSPLRTRPRRRAA